MSEENEAASGLKLEQDGPKEIARFEVVVYENGAIGVSDDQIEKYEISNIMMWLRQLLWILETAYLEWQKGEVN